MTRTLMLFDVDGTLLHTGGAGMRAMRRAASGLFGEGFRWDGVQVSGHLDPMIFAAAVANNGLTVDAGLHERFRESYLDLLRVELAARPEAVRLMPGVREALVLLRGMGGVPAVPVLGLLTGNYSGAVPIKFEAVGLDPRWFTITAFGDEAPSREDLVAMAMSKYRVRWGEPIGPRRVVVIGDTPRDVACARAHGCVAFAVATGPYSAQELEAAGADVVVQDLTDPRPLLRFVEGG